MTHARPLGPARSLVPGWFRACGCSWTFREPDPLVQIAEFVSASSCSVAASLLPARAITVESRPESTL